MRAGAVCTLLAAVSLAAPAAAQWAKVNDPALRRSRSGEVDLEGPAPRIRGAADLSGVWLADGGPVPEEVGPTVESDLLLERHFINAMADKPPGEVPLQPWAAELLQRRLATEGRDDPAAHCKPSSAPVANVTPLPFKIVQTPKLVLILYEGDTVFRQIFLDGRQPVDDPVPRWMGYSSGKWERDALVVDTIGFNDEHWLDGMGHPATAKLHLTERFRRPDAGHLEIETTVDDPGAYTKPFTYLVKLSLLPGEDLLEYFCSENEKDVQHYQ
jgi:hypothetical protein